MVDFHESDMCLTWAVHLREQGGGVMCMLAVV